MFFPEGGGGAFLPVGIVEEFEAAEEAEAEGEAFEGDVHLVDGHEGALAGIALAEGGGGEGGPFSEAFVYPLVHGFIEFEPGAEVGGEGVECGAAVNGGEDLREGLGEDGGHEAEEFFAVEVLVEGGGMAMEDFRGGLEVDAFACGAEDAETEGEVLVIDGAEERFEAAGGEEVGGADGEVERPGVAEVVPLVRLELVVEEDGGGVGEEGVEYGGAGGGHFPGGLAEDHGAGGER